MFPSFGQEIPRDFMRITKQDWLKMAKQELLGKDPAKVLMWQYDPEIALYAYYDEDNYPCAVTQQAAALQVATPLGSALRKWDTLLYFSRLQGKNAAAYAKLCQVPWCDGLLYDVGAHTTDMPACFLEKVQHRAFPLFYRLSADNPVQQATFSALIRSGKWPAATCLWMARSATFPLLTTPTPSLDNTAIQAAGASPSVQIAHVLAALSAYLKDACSSGHTLSEALHAVLLVQAAEPDYYHEIAKLRALRLCMGKIAAAFGAKTPWATRFRIMGTTNLCYQSCLDPVTNLLRGTLSSMALVLGGVNYLLPLPQVGISSPVGGVHGARLALNVSQLMKVEADMEQLADPAAGSYFLEYLTDALARKGWEKFQHIVKNGGLSAPAVQRELLDACATRQQQQHAALIAGHHPFVEVNAHVQAPITAQVCFSRSSSDLYLHAYPSLFAPYEALRHGAHVFFKKRQKPHMHLVTLRKDTHTFRLQRYVQDMWGGIGLDVPEDMYMLDEPLPHMPCACVCIAPKVWMPDDVKRLQRLLVVLRKKSAFTPYLACLQAPLPVALRTESRLHVLTFPADASLVGWQRTQTLFFDELSRF